MSGFDDKAKNLFIATLKSRLGGRMLQCPLCQTARWSVADGYVLTPLTNDPPRLQLGGASLPSVALVCAQCGHTVFFNLAALGIRDLVAPGSPVDPMFTHITTPKGDD